MGHIVDIVLAIIFIFAIIKGFRNGLIKELTIVASLLLAIVAAILFHPIAAKILEGHVSDSFLIPASYALVIVAIIVIVWLIGAIVRVLIHSVGLEIIDRILGSTFRLIKSVLAISVLYVGLLWAVDNTGIKLGDSFENSVILDTTEPIRNFIVDGDYKNRFEEIKDKVIHKD